MKDQVVGLELEEQVTSLEPSKELKRLGVKQDSLWYWVLLDGYFDYQLVQKGYDPHLRTITKDFCCAFTVAEHGEALPGQISVMGTNYYLDMGKIDSQSMYYVRYVNHDMHDTVRKVNGKTEADARAKMRIMLIKDKLMEV